MTAVCGNKIKKFVILKKIYKRSKKKVICKYSKNYIVSNILIEIMWIISKFGTFTSEHI